MSESTEAASITIVRVIAAPLAAVFEAWTDPACLQQWLAPSPCSVAEASADVRLGGRYRVVAVDPLGNRHVTTGEYRELVRDTRLVKTWVYEGPNYADPYPTLLTVDFREVGPASTEISLRQDQLLAPEDRAGNREGWRLCFEKLEALLRPTV
ncbi:MAG: SRPBCC domain-containing protein [Labilithrix sp.]|nr:SRPBCC domain-containing protein [Labilithrix sp.]MBX3223011.1 SRPBCC domain-containing protein [Labilithrix sp.]